MNVTESPAMSHPDPWCHPECCCHPEPARDLVLFAMLQQDTNSSSRGRDKD
jgi:hypothetical protein